MVILGLVLPTPSKQNRQLRQGNAAAHAYTPSPACPAQFLSAVARTARRVKYQQRKLQKQTSCTYTSPGKPQEDTALHAAIMIRGMLKMARRGASFSCRGRANPVILQTLKACTTQHAPSSTDSKDSTHCTRHMCTAAGMVDEPVPPTVPLFCVKLQPSHAHTPLPLLLTILKACKLLQMHGKPPSGSMYTIATHRAGSHTKPREKKHVTPSHTESAAVWLL